MTVATLLWAIGITFCLAQISNFCTTIYLHRALTHRGLKLHPAVAFLMHLELFLATGIAPQEWAAVHRKHHQFSDQEGDPHSPYLEGLWKVLFFNFLLYRKEIRNPETIRKYTPNWQKDWIDRLPPLAGKLGPILGATILALSFGALLHVTFWTGALLGVASWYLHAGVYIFLNSMVNSVCHKIGYRNFDNKATNLQWVAWITAGEGLHNNHHEFPTSARMKAFRWEFDPAWPVIRLLEKLGLAEYPKSLLAKAA
ncbi:MAG TPA: fatty acid desaturase [Bryobacterales bacterium]|nr:fatty acid desaturase [Bryobacterales bacterium]